MLSSFLVDEPNYTAMQDTYDMIYDVLRNTQETITDENMALYAQIIREEFSGEEQQMLEYLWECRNEIQLAREEALLLMRRIESTP